MYQMSKDGELRVEARGRYTLPHNHHNHHNQKVTEVMEVMGGDEQEHTNSHLSADKGNERVQQLIDEGMRPDLAVHEVLGEEL